MSALADLSTSFVGRRGRLFWLALKTSVLTVLTLGFYRFWMKTRLRRFYLSSIRPGGQPLEYLGEPLEKLLGFLIAVVFLAFYIGVVNLILMFLSFALLQGNVAAYVLSFVGVIPILFYAQYRARRYILARTRWRGIRFGLEPGAWGYAGRALWHWIITLASLGVFWPRMTYRLEKFRTDRTTYGTVTLTQGGGWGMLYPAYLLFYIPALVTAGCVAVAVWFDDEIALVAMMISVPVALFGWVFYQVAAFRLMAATKSAGDVGFIAAPRSWRVFWIYGFGYFLAGLVMFSVLIAALILLGAALGLSGSLSIDLDNIDSLTNAGLPFWAATAIGVAFYFSFFIGWGVLRQVFVTLPLMKHYAETLSITGVSGLLAVRQTERDRFAEAEGFAEALDVGAAI